MKKEGLFLCKFNFIQEFMKKHFLIRQKVYTFAPAYEAIFNFALKAVEKS